MRRPLLLLSAAGALGLSALGCGTGAMRQAITRDDACAASDSRCARLVDAPVAVGASLRPDVHLELRGTTAPPMHLESARATVLSVDGDRVTGKADGLAALLFVTDDGTVVDLVHVWVQRATGLALERVRADGRKERVEGLVELCVGEELLIDTTLMGGSQRLSGEAPATWKLEGASAQLLADGKPSRRRVVARAPGRASLEVAAADVSSHLDLLVHAPVSPSSPVAEVAR